MELKYGGTSFTLELPPERILAEILKPDLAAEIEHPEIAILSALEDYSDTIRSFNPGEKVVIVTSDITRYTGSELYLPLLVDRLNSSGIMDNDIEILIALGIHRKQTDLEHRKIIGSLHRRIRVVDHDCDNPDGIVAIGKTTGGIDVEVNRRVVEADRVILTGSIGFHYFAGFSGGRKAILPGVSSRRSCMASHLAVLNSGNERGKNPMAVTGNLEGNPVHGAMMEACAMVAPDLLLNTVVGHDNKVVAAFAGDWREAHLAGCRYYAERFSVPIREKADLVVVSCGGLPKDINLIQAHKSMEYGSRALRDGGVMILLAQCPDGYGHPGFFKWFRVSDLDEHESELRRNYEINGQTAFSIKQKCGLFRIILFSCLPPSEVVSMGMDPAANLHEAFEKAEAYLPKDYRSYVIPEGGTVLPVVKSPDPHS
jgi:lactate racemase